MAVMTNESGEDYVTVSNSVNTISKLETSSQQNKTGNSNEINRVPPPCLEHALTVSSKEISVNSMSTG